MNISNEVGSARGVDPSVAPTVTPAAAPASTPAASAGVGIGAATAPGSDQATISSTSGVLAAALHSSDVRTAKVASLKASIDAGTYNVPASSVADKLLSSILGS